MPRGPRYIPPGWSVEVTTATVCGFYLLPATAQFSRIFVGILGRAQKKYPVKIHAAVAVSSHYHLILTPEDAEQLARFMEHVNGNLAREAGQLIGWRGRFWRERYHLIPISPESDALVERLRYVLSNVIKENLVAKVSEWEGLHCAEALIEGNRSKASGTPGPKNTKPDARPSVGPLAPASRWRRSTAERSWSTTKSSSLRSRAG